MRKSSFLKMICIVFIFCVMTAIASLAQTFTTVASFGSTGGAEPMAGLVQATNGNLYGTTLIGGAKPNGLLGTVFTMTLSGTLTTLHIFSGQQGRHPQAALVQATNGDFYGTTNYKQSGPGDKGTIFKMTPSGAVTTLHRFDGTDGCVPYSGALVQAPNGNLYGTTDSCGANGYGTVFEITPSGTLTTLYSFCSQTTCVDGANPSTGLIQATDGNFYGTTSEGGANNNSGTVFTITPSGALTTLYSFCSQSGCADGLGPLELVQATDGNFYGTTQEGGANSDGTVFKITPSGRLTTLYSFCSQSGCPDGLYPVAGLIQATDRNFYGTTLLGGAKNSGTVFEITPSGGLTTLHSFCSDSVCSDGSEPSAALVQDTNGTLYGTTPLDGGWLNGTVFSLSVGLGPFVKTNPTSGKVGAKVIILGNNLKGTTSVTFNGTTAPLLKVTASAIETRVPTGATTGRVIVTTPNRTLNSNVAFRVLP
jgi:uncharacterized repeat protein (TIGR03803 family)